jgi:glycosyltransferase involved in cell wall biosynthesis
VNCDVLLIGASDTKGGAARAAYRLHQGLQQVGTQSCFLVQDKETDDPTVLGPPNRGRWVLDKVRNRLGESLVRLSGRDAEGKQSVNLVPSGLHRRVNDLHPEVVHLHWLGHETISIREIARIDAPIVWTLHDMWAFSGTNHYVRRDENHVPDRSSAAERSWMDRWLRRWKKTQWSNLDLTIVTPSAWLAREARRSTVLGEHRIRVIPNGIDLDTFKPIDTSAARAVFDLPESAPLVLFGAINALTNRRKGAHLLRPALHKLLDRREDAELVVFGTSGGLSDEERERFGGRVHSIGRLSDSSSLALLYSAADVFAIPSMQDNLPNTIMEALACGTPSVGFDVGGIPEMIEHRITGYVAEAHDVDEFARGLEWVLAEKRRDDLATASRKKAESEYALPIISRRYRRLYREVAT